MRSGLRHPRPLTSNPSESTGLLSLWEKEIPAGGTETDCQEPHPEAHRRHEPTCPGNMGGPASPSSTRMPLHARIHRTSPCSHSHGLHRALVDGSLTFLCGQVSPRPIQGKISHTSNQQAGLCHSSLLSQHDVCPCQDAGHPSCQHRHGLLRCADATQEDTGNHFPCYNQRHL